MAAASSKQIKLLLKGGLLLEFSQWKAANLLHASPQPSLGIQLSNIIGTLSQMLTSKTETQFEDEPPQILLANLNL